jgi:peptide/nickel transport system substrate-binding protein
MLGLGGVAGLAGCTGGDGGETTTGGTQGTGTMEGTTPEMTATPEPGAVQGGGHLRLSGLNPPQTLSPFKGINQGDYIFFELMYDRLTDYNRDFEVVPRLAKAWEPNEDASAWTFTLREGATFDTIDQEVLAEDVKATADVMASEDKVPGAGRSLGPLDRMEVLDDYRVKAHLTKPDNVYPGRLAETGSWFNIVPKNVIEDRFDELSSKDFGSGPYNLTDFQQDVEYVFEADSDWFDTDHQGNSLPIIDKLTAIIIQDPVGQVNALTDSRVDVLNKIQTKNRSQAAQADGSTVKGYATSSFLSMVMYTTLEKKNGDQPFSKPKVRKAMKHAMDREEISAATDNTMVPGHHDPVSPVHPDYAPFDAGMEFGTTSQPDEAKKLLEEAGYGDGLDLPTPIYSTDFDERRGTSVALFQQQAREAGIRFDIQLVSADTWLSDYWNQENGWYASGYAARMEQTTVHRLGLHNEAKWNSGRWQNEQYNEHFDVFSQTTDEQKFVDNFQAAQEIMHLNGPWIIFGFTRQYAANNDYMGRYVPGPATNRGRASIDPWLTSDAPEGPS